MEKKSFKKYFSQTKKILFWGIGVFVAGFILFLLIYFNIIRSFDLYQAAWLIMVAGVVMIMCHFTIRVRDGAVDEYAATFHKELENELEEFVNESEKHKKINRVFSYTSGGYELWNENAKITVFGADNTPRCVLYGGGAVTYTPDTLYAVTGNIDLISGDTRTNRFSVPLADVKDVKITDKSYTKEYKKKNKYIESFAAEIITGSVSLSFTVHSDAMTDDAVEKIKRAADSKKVDID